MQWVKRVAKAMNFDEGLVEDQRALIYTYGSYRLGVHNPGGDIGEGIEGHGGQ